MPLCAMELSQQDGQLRVLVKRSNIRNELIGYQVHEVLEHTKSEETLSDVEKAIGVRPYNFFAIKKGLGVITKRIPEMDAHTLDKARINAGHCITHPVKETMPMKDYVESQVGYSKTNKK